MNLISEEDKFFFDTNGYLVKKNFFKESECDSLKEKMLSLKNEFANEIGVSIDDYMRNITQWRDLWSKDNLFRNFISDARVWKSASILMNAKGATLFFDQLISKPPIYSNDLPWHRDLPFWPVNGIGLSCWIPLQTTTKEMGTLEFISGSHKWEVNQAVDFINEDFSELNNHPDKIQIEAYIGDVVFIHGLVWHYSSKNQKNITRDAYVSSWIPPESVFSPELSDWHPSMEHITVSPGEHLNEDWFLSFGERTNYLENKSTIKEKQKRKDENNLNIFNSKKYLEKLFKKILRPHIEINDSLELGQILSIPDVINLITKLSIENQFIEITKADSLSKTLKDLRITSEAYRLNRSRNVSSSSYKEWKELMGTKWEDKFGE
ncbi:MAG: phytanoyl-CoA dioxygenase family protein [Leptospiraceae bacterium]|nr:phytanoyl-CoA dioxygenase family protein [Leptospiraceae bacterium]